MLEPLETFSQIKSHSSVRDMQYMKWFCSLVPYQVFLLVLLSHDQDKKLQTLSNIVVFKNETPTFILSKQTGLNVFKIMSSSDGTTIILEVLKYRLK